MSENDVIVIGAGSAGCAVAGRLAERGLKIVMLEAGGSDMRLPIMMPAATYLKAIGNPRFDWRYTAQPDPTRFGRSDYMPRGKVLGGSSSINGMLYVRGQPQDFDDWADQGCAGWSYADVLPYYKRSEANENGENDVHGGDGPLSVSNLRVSHPISDAFIRSAQQVGIPRMDDLNRPPQHGVGYLQATQRRGRRCSSYQGYIRSSRYKRHIQTITNAHVVRILFDGQRAIGVEYVRDKVLHRVLARAVVVSGGALSSPHILMHSGIGAEKDLKTHGIEVRHALRGVGKNFHDHAGTSHIVWTNAATYNVQTSVLHQLWYGARWLLLGTGPGSTPDAHALAFVKTEAGADRSDIQYHFTPAGYDLDEKGPILFDSPAVTALNNLHRPASRGHVGLASSDPLDHPAIQPNLLAESQDVERLIAGAKLLREIFATEPLRKYVVEEFKPGKDVQTHDEWTHYIRQSAMGIYHPAGTCKMGVTEDAVVDPKLQVRGMDGLFVADASIMPVIVSGNLNATCIMIGERCADFVGAYLNNKLAA